MSMTTTSTPPAPKKIPTSVAKPQPLVVFFDGDERVKNLLSTIQRYRRIAFHQLETVPQADLERIVLVTNERQIDANYAELRKPNVRVIALADNRFKDPRFDGAVYAYMPSISPLSLVERMLDNAIDHIQLLSNRTEINKRLAGATREIHELNQIGAALSAEHDTGKLLELILTKAREITRVTPALFI
jgi:hypothetical protein